MLELLKDTRKHLMTGVSYMIPVIVAGGVLFALAVMLSGKAATPETGFLGNMAKIGSAGFTLFIPIMGGFIAFSMVDRPGIAPGLIGAYLANSVGAGFLGGLIAGLLAGIVVYYLKKIKVPSALRSVMPIFVIPLLGSFITGMLVLYVIGSPIAGIMTGLKAWLMGMQSASKVVLGLILGCMIAFDMGGPVNKVAFFFAVAMIQTNPELMAAVAVPVCTPPLGLGVATLINKKKFTGEEVEAGKAALVMGCVGITEGAIPFAAADPLHVIPSIMAGGACASVTSLLLGATNHAAWGGLIVLPVVGNIPGYLIAVAVGIAVTAACVLALKKEVKDVTPVAESGADEVELDID